MSATHCEHERDVLDAARSGSWPATLAAHAAACPACAELTLVACALNAAAAETPSGPLPDAGRIWAAARRRARQRELEQATMPITVMVRLTLGATVAAAAVGLVWLWPAVADQFAAVARSLTAPAAAGAGESSIAFFALATVATFTAAFALFETWVGE